MELTRIAMTVLILALVAAQPARADYAAGQSAWDAGRTDEAVVQWQAAADAGDRRAMLALGRLYLQGLGVIQDYVEAHKWLNLAASRGEAAALKERDALAAQMTPAQIATAQERAAAWRLGASRADGAQETTGAQATVSAPAPAPVATSDPEAGPPPPRAIREAQTLLGALGYRPGPADGVWGRRTGQAYRAFLRDTGLPAADTLTPEALRAMRAVAGRGDAGPEPGRGTTVAADVVQAPSDAGTPPPTPVRPDALHRAAQAGDIEGLTAALDAGVDIDARDGRGWTALMHAVNKGYLLLVEPLLAAKADPDVRAPDGATALFMAAVHGHSEIVGLLMKAGADLSVRGPQGRTAVDAARARYGDVEAARANGEALGVVALVQGMTWTEAQDAQKAVDEMIASLKPKCAGKAKIRECWVELANKSRCYVWIRSIYGNDFGPGRNSGFTSRWSGQCSGNMHGSVAIGSGTLTYVWNDEKGYRHSHEDTGMLKNGKKHDRWIDRYSTRRPWAGSHQDEGGYVDGKREGNWVERSTMDSTYYRGGKKAISQGSYLNDRREGRWTDRWPQSGRTYVSNYRFGKKVGFVQNDEKRKKKKKTPKPGLENRS